MRAFPVLMLALLTAPATAEPPPIKRPVVATRAETMFDKADTDHDGYLSKAEYVAALNAINRARSVTPTATGWARAEAQFDAIDRARTGRIARSVFVAAAVAHFDGADLNHDGTVTAQEARKAAKIKQQVIDSGK